MNGIVKRLIVPACLLAGMTLAGAAEKSAEQKPKAQAGDQELGEVLVKGARSQPERNLQTVMEWMRRLIGQFRYQGYVELHNSQGTSLGRQNVQGQGDCVPFGLAPGVQCSLKVNWPEKHGEGGTELPGGVSTLSPAMTLYGLDPDNRGIHFLEVDNRGIANGGLGYLTGDTLTTKAPCEGIPGDCQRTTKINARPDGKLIQTQIDIEQDGQVVASYMFLQRPIMRFKEDAPAGAK